MSGTGEGILVTGGENGWVVSVSGDDGGVAGLVLENGKEVSSNLTCLET